MDPLFNLQNVTKAYGSARALDDVTMSVLPHQVVGIIGPNGAGKTTLIKIVLGLLGGWRGSIQVFGTDYHTDPLKIKRELGYVPEVVAPPGQLRVQEYLQYMAALHNVPAATAEQSWNEYAEQLAFDIDPRAFVGTLSKGNRQKLVIVASILHRPRLWVLDEPISGLDPTGIIFFKKMIRDYARNTGAVLISTHILSFVEGLCDRVFVLLDGRIVGDRMLNTCAERAHVPTAIESYYNEITASQSRLLR